MRAVMRVADSSPTPFDLGLLFDDELWPGESPLVRVPVQAGIPKSDIFVRRSIIDPYIPFIVETLLLDRLDQWIAREFGDERSYRSAVNKTAPTP